MSRQALAERLARALSGVDTKHFGQISRERWRHDKPRNYEELHSYFKAVHGVDMPVTSCSEEMNAPFEYFADLFFGRSRSTLCMAPRGGGKTYGVGITLNASMKFREDRRLYVHTAAEKSQGLAISRVLDECLVDPIAGTNRPTSRTRNGTTKKVMANGVLFYQVTGSASGVNSHHPHVLTFDEIEWADFEAIMQAFPCVVDCSNGEYGVFSGLSTRQQAYGAMNRLVSTHKERDIKLYQFSIFEVMEPCKTCIALDAHPNGTDAAREAVCPLWPVCHGQRARKSRGWMTREFVASKCLQLGGAESVSFQAQYLCLLADPEGLVFPQFSDREYVHRSGQPDIGNIYNWQYDPNLDLYAFIDPAEGQQAVVLFAQVDDYGRIYVFDELVVDRCTHDGQLKQEFYAHWAVKRGYKEPILIVDPHKPESISAFRDGIIGTTGQGAGRAYEMVMPADIRWTTHKNASSATIAPTTALVNQYIYDPATGSRRLFFNREQCSRTIVEGIKEHHYVRAPNGVHTSMPAKTPATDFTDPIRYGVATLHRMMRVH